MEKGSLPRLHLRERSPPKDFLRNARHHLPCPRVRERLGELGGEWGLISMAAQASEAASKAVSESAFESNNDPTVGLFTDADAVSEISFHMRYCEFTP